MTYTFNASDLGHYFGAGFGFILIAVIIGIVLMAAIVALKGYALWTAARRSEKGWFIALLIVNTMGILELVYLYVVADVWGKKKASAPISEAPQQEVPPSVPPIVQ